LVALDTQAWHQAGWQYSAVGDFITDVAYAVEMEAPGFAKRAIPAFRDVLRNAKPLPPETGIVVTRLPEGVDDHYARTADDLARGLGLADSEGVAPEQFRFCFGDIPVDPDGMMLYRLCGLHREQVSWSVPDQETAVDAVRPAMQTDLTQLALEWI
jgi:hypothetical protein